MLEWEVSLWNQKHTFIAGVDEVGRGCLFGDVLAAAVILPEGLIIEGIKDSKTISAKRREFLYEIILNEALSVAIGRVPADIIDKMNIKQATKLAMKIAIEGLTLPPSHVLVDSEKPDIIIPFTSLIHGDQLSQSIAAASIVAKVTRDRLCQEWDALYPEYGIAYHKGYGTTFHREKILELGLTPMHRKQFCRHIGFQLVLF